jgi:hypothetical protein
MNERIKELAEQAMESTGIEGLGGSYMELNTEKFAELIVRECIVEFYRQYFDDSVDEDITVTVERYVEDLFRGDDRLNRIEEQLRQQAHELRNGVEP